MSRTEEMQRLVAKLQADRTARIADVASMQDQTATFLDEARTDQAAVAEAIREEMAAERAKRSDEREQMSTETATFRADVRTQHQMVSQQMRTHLAAEPTAHRPAGRQDGG